MHIFGRFTALMALLGTLFSISPALGAKLHHGVLEDGVYYSSTGSFDIVLPQGSKIFDGAHPLGGYLVISKLQKPKLLWGLSYNKVAMAETGLDAEAERGIILAGRDFWAQSYEGAPLDIISQEWIDVGGEPALFTLHQFPKKSSFYYGTLSLRRDNYAYVLFEKIQVKKATREQLLTPSDRLDSLMDFRAAVRFHDDGTVKFKLGAEE